MGVFAMPSLGADMDAGTVTRWLVKPGDDVHRGDIVAVVDTEKSTIDVEIFETGRIEELLVPEGQCVPVGTALARVGPISGEARRAGPAGATRERHAHRPQASRVEATPPGRGTVLSPVVRHLAEHLGVDIASVGGTGPGGRITRADVERAAGSGAPRLPATPAVPAPAPPSAPGTRPRASPLARRLAEELGVDLRHIAPGRGPGGAVVEADVRAAAVAPAEAGAAAAVSAPGAAAVGKAVGGKGASAPSALADKQAAMRRAIGTLMARSKREIPHYYLSTTIDMTAASSWLEQQNLARPLPSRLVMPVLLLKATALAVSAVPEMNGFFVDDRFQPSAAVHVGVAVSLRGGGVIAPALHDVATLSLDELMAALHDLVNRARHGSLRSSEMSDPTITVTNLGDLGVESVFGVIYPPQVALVGFGRVQERPWAHQGMVGARPTVVATLSADHRASDGHRGGTFLGTIDKLLQTPEEL